MEAVVSIDWATEEADGRRAVVSEVEGRSSESAGAAEDLTGELARAYFSFECLDEKRERNPVIVPVGVAGGKGSENGAVELSGREG